MELPLCSFKHEKMEGADLPEILVNFCYVTSQKTLFLMPVYKLKYAPHSRTTSYFEEQSPVVNCDPVLMPSGMVQCHIV